MKRFLSVVLALGMLSGCGFSFHIKSEDELVQDMKKSIEPLALSEDKTQPLYQEVVVMGSVKIPDTNLFLLQCRRGDNLVQVMSTKDIPIGTTTLAYPIHYQNFMGYTTHMVLVEK